MLKRVLRSLASLRRSRNEESDRLYYLTGIKPIKANKHVLDECTVTK